ncbi:uncharacterized protein LOC116853624 [Odontomachus brunneus]|uniref:uncharacterized protein LOC116853624 n=1 Tax=Odontomachus brunneus TaxID=486640 RepID=UPI0013F20D2F|nr:uncharacterized protein LOC116853624 [Odontomachus brunneus]
MTKDTKILNLLGNIRNFGINNNISTIVQQSTSAPKEKTILQYEKENDPTMAVQKEKQYFSLQDVPIYISGYNVVPENVEDFNIKDSMKQLEQNMQQVLRMQAISQIKLQEICQRLDKLENAIKNRALNLPQQNDALIAQFLPLASIDTIKEFESLLKTTEEAVMQFYVYIFRYQY